MILNKYLNSHLVLWCLSVKSDLCRESEVEQFCGCICSRRTKVKALNLTWGVRWLAVDHFLFCSCPLRLLRWLTCLTLSSRKLSKRPQDGVWCRLAQPHLLLRAPTWHLKSCADTHIVAPLLLVEVHKELLWSQLDVEKRSSPDANVVMWS